MNPTVTDRQTCLDRQQRPPLERSERREDGSYYHNLQRKHVAKRYENDDDDEPVFGFKLKDKVFRLRPDESGPSVNEVECAGCPECSIAVHPTPQSFYHVLTIDLAELRTRLPAHPFAAVFLPVKDPPNDCHFELLPMEGTTRSLQALRQEMDQPFPDGKKVPRDDEGRKAAADAWKDYRRLFPIRRWVRPKA